jgi:hypothetical protein
MNNVLSLTALSLILASPLTAQIDALPGARLKETITIDPGGHPIHNDYDEERASGDVIVADDFSDFVNWASIAEDGTIANWDWLTETPVDVETHMGEMNSTTEENGFAIFNGLHYLLDADVEMQNASLVYEPLINCEDASSVILSFEQRYRGFNYCKTYIEVSNNAGVSYDFQYEINARSYVNQIPIQETITLNITEAAAGNSEVKIRFRWEETSEDDLYGSGYAWMIDDFVLSEGWNADVKITDVHMQSGVGGLIENGMTYYLIYEHQATEIELSATVENFASTMQEDVKLNVEVIGPTGHSCMSAVTDLEIAGKDSLFCTTSFTPSDAGTYTIKFWFDSELAEDVVSNDTIMKSIEVGSEFNDYARHDGIETGSIANLTSNTGSPFLIGNLMQFFDVSEFREVSVHITDDSTNLGQHIYIQLMKYNAETSEFIYIEQSEDHLINESNLGTKVSIYFEEEQCYKANEYGLILVGHYGGMNPVHFSLAQNVEEKTVLGYTSGATDPFYLENPQALMIQIEEMEHGYCNIGIQENESAFNLSQNKPNPFSESTTITYELVKNTDVQFTITDLSGKVIKTINLGNQTAGKHELRLNGNDFSEGVYFYTFNVGDESVTKRMIVVK